MTREELNEKVDWEGGIAEAIIGYGLTADDLPADAYGPVIEAWKRLQSQGARDIRLIGDWLEGKTELRETM